MASATAQTPMAPEMAPLNSLCARDLQPFANAEPRIRDIRIAERLGMAQPLNIRQSIERNREELEGFGSIHTTCELIEVAKGARRQVTVYWLNEGQALVICMLSRTPAAVQVRKEVIEVFMAYRRGRLTASPTAEATPEGLHLPARALALHTYLRSVLSVDEWRPLSLHEMCQGAAEAGADIRFGTVQRYLGPLLKFSLVLRRPPAGAHLPYEYRLPSTTAPFAPPAQIALPLGNRHAIVDGRLIDMSPTAYPKGSEVAAIRRDGSLGLFRLLEAAPIPGYRIGRVGAIDLGPYSPSAPTTRVIEDVVVIGTALPPGPGAFAAAGAMLDAEAQRVLQLTASPEQDWVECIASKAEVTVDTARRLLAALGDAGKPQEA